MRTKKSQVRVPRRIGAPPKWLPLLDSFVNGSDDVLELVPDPGEYKNFHTMQSTACTAIHKYGFAISTYTKDGKLYLVKDHREESK